MTVAELITKLTIIVVETGVDPNTTVVNFTDGDGLPLTVDTADLRGGELHIILAS